MVSNQHKASYIFQMVLLAFASVAIQLVLGILTVQALSSSAVSIFPAPRRTFGTATKVILSSCSVLWNDEVWTCVADAQFAPGSIKARPLSAHVMAINVQTGKARETKITLSPAPIGLLVVNDQLYAVSETCVTRIDDKQDYPRHPIRSLIQSTPPFVFQGKLAVIDTNRSNVHTLLSWDGLEWNDEGQVDVPSTVHQPGVISELRVLSSGDKIHLFILNNQVLNYREGIEFLSELEPISALDPENDPPMPLSHIRQFRAGTSTNVPTNWSSTWEIAETEDGPRFFCQTSPIGNPSIQVYEQQSGNWVTAGKANAIETSSFGVTSGAPNYLVADDMSLYTLRGSKFQPALTNDIVNESRRVAMSGVVRILYYLIPTGVLVLGAWRLMSVHRKPEYTFGKRHVIRASLLRRAIARGVDLVITNCSVVLWLSSINNLTWNSQQSNVAYGVQQDTLALLFFSTLATWLVIHLAYSYLEGNWGLTPGKWLCGIRTFRTTLRPCGMLRALARELMVYIDGVMFLTWLPGVLLIAFTESWQRLGDLTADTVVVLDPKKPSYWVQNTVE